MMHWGEQMKLECICHKVQSDVRSNAIAIAKVVSKFPPKYDEVSADIQYQARLKSKIKMSII